MKLLEEMGTDLVSLANNHVYDYGPEAMIDTMDLLDEAGIPYVGGGRNIEEAEKTRILYCERNEDRICGSQQSREDPLYRRRKHMIFSFDITGKG